MYNTKYPASFERAKCEFDLVCVQNFKSDAKLIGWNCHKFWSTFDPMTVQQCEFSHVRCRDLAALGLNMLKSSTEILEQADIDLKAHMAKHRRSIL